MRVNDTTPTEDAGAAHADEGPARETGPVHGDGGVADHAGDSETDIPEMDYEAHQQPFDAFLGLIRIGVILVVILLIGMAVFLL